MTLIRVEDKEGDWLRQSFMMPRTTVNLIEQRKKLFNGVSTKFVDSSLGGNFYINPFPQYTEFSDLPIPTGLDGFGGFYDGSGMGPYYSKAFDDNAQVIYMRFGVPEYNSLTTFFTGFYDSGASLLARTGRAPGFFYKTGRALGLVATIPLWPIILAGNMYRWAMNNPASKFYYMKPTMPLYWNAVNTMVNRLAVDMGIIPRMFSERQKQFLDPEITTTDNELTKADLEKLHSVEPDIYDEKGGINIYAVANKATRKFHRYREQMKKIQDQATSAAELSRSVRAYLEGENLTQIAKNKGETNGLDGILDKYLASKAGYPDGATDDASFDAIEEKTGRATEDKDGNIKPGWIESLLDFGMAELSDGSAFVGFKVNYTGTVSESFSSTTKESDLASTINSRSSTARNMRFSFANGNVGDGAIAGSIETVLGVAKDFVTGIGDGFQISGIAALFGSAFADIPEHWENSSFSAPTSTFTIQLRTPYGNKLSRFNNLMVPLCMLLAGVLPLSAGTHAYTSPFLCELWNRGRSLIRLGMITELSVSRGEGNLGWTKEDEPLGIDVTFTVKDFTTIMHMPLAVETFFGLENQNSLFSEDTAYSDYMATLASMTMADQFYISRRFALAMTRSMVQFRRWTNPAYYANWFNGTTIGRAANLVSREIDRTE